MLFITHASLSILPEYLRYGWRLVIDETPQVTDSERHNDMLWSFLRLVDATPEGVKYSRLTPNDLRAMETVAGIDEERAKGFKNEDGSYRYKMWTYKALAAALANPNMEVYALTEQWTRRFVEGSQISVFTVLTRAPS